MWCTCEDSIKLTPTRVALCLPPFPLPLNLIRDIYIYIFYLVYLILYILREPDSDAASILDSRTPFLNQRVNRLARTSS